MKKNIIWGVVLVLIVLFVGAFLFSGSDEKVNQSFESKVGDFGDKCSTDNDCVGNFECENGECNCLITKELFPVCDKEGKEYDNPSIAKCYGKLVHGKQYCDDYIKTYKDYSNSCSGDVDCSGNYRCERGKCICEMSDDLQKVCDKDGIEYDNPSVANCKGIEDVSFNYC